MIRRNREGNTDYDLPHDWFSGRKPGVSAMLRVHNEEEFIGPALLSIAPFFDELLLVLNRSTDRTRQIAEGLNLPHLRILDYPFELFPNGPGHDEYPDDSLQEISYFYNWCLCQTTRQVVCKWDGDMVALPHLNVGLKRRVERAKTLSFAGTNLAGRAFAHISADQPIAGAEPRFFRVAPHTFYQQGPACEVFQHGYERGNEHLKDPLYLHFKWAKSEASATAIWPKNWRSDPHFMGIYARQGAGAIYAGPMPDALLEDLIERSLTAARQVEDLKSQEQVMRTEARVLARLRENEVAGDFLEIGCKLGKNTVFIARLVETLFPDRRVVSVDPFSSAGAALSLHNAQDTIDDIFEQFTVNTAGIADHHQHHRKDSRALEDSDVPNGLAYAFIDGEHTYDGVMADWRFVYERTQPGGVIAVDDYKNGSWPGVIEAYDEILETYPVTVLNEETKSAFLLVGDPAKHWGPRPSPLQRITDRLRGRKSRRSLI